MWRAKANVLVYLGKKPTTGTSFHALKCAKLQINKTFSFGFLWLLFFILTLLFVS